MGLTAAYDLLDVSDANDVLLVQNGEKSGVADLQLFQLVLCSFNHAVTIVRVGRQVHHDVPVE